MKFAKKMNGKRCTRCKSIKAIVEFYANAGSYDGLAQECKPCKELSRAETIERARLSAARWDVYKRTAKRAQCKAVAIRMSAQSNADTGEWMHHLMQDGRDRIRSTPFISVEERRERERWKEYLKYWEDQGYRAKRLEHCRQSHLDRPWVMLTRKHRRDARMAGVVDDGSVTVEVIKTLWLTTIECIYCGRDLNDWNKSVEHMIPTSRGGEHSTRNVVVICRLCNEMKRAMPFDEWVVMLQEPWRSISHDVLVQNYSGSS